MVVDKTLPIAVNSSMRPGSLSGVEPHGSVELVGDDLDVVDPLEHHRLPNFVRGDPSRWVMKTRLIVSAVQPQGDESHTSAGQRLGEKGQALVHPLVDPGVIVGELLVQIRNPEFVQPSHEPAHAIEHRRWPD